MNYPLQEKDVEAFKRKWLEAVLAAHPTAKQGKGSKGSRFQMNMRAIYFLAQLAP